MGIVYIHTGHTYTSRVSTHWLASNTCLPVDQSYNHLYVYCVYKNSQHISIGCGDGDGTGPYDDDGDPE